MYVYMYVCYNAVSTEYVNIISHYYIKCNRKALNFYENVFTICDILKWGGVV